MTDPLRPLWDFDDLDATEARFRALRAEALTQLARVQGLREDYDAGDQLLDEVAEEDPRVRIRVHLERGRLRRSSGQPEAALPLFERAFAAAVEAGEDWLAGDAAHMAALAAPDRDGFVAWTNRGLELADRSEAAAYWAGPLLNNLGWEYFDAEEYEQALDAFERALAVREEDPDNLAAIELAREAVAEARKALGRD
jgi:tetratricopeptide (TPR) repeat protein